MATTKEEAGEAVVTVEVEEAPNTEEEAGGVVNNMPNELTSFRAISNANKLRFYVYCQGCKERDAYNIEPGEGIKAKI